MNPIDRMMEAEHRAADGLWEEYWRNFRPTPTPPPPPRRPTPWEIEEYLQRKAADKATA